MAGSKQLLRVDVVSDIMCPWCWVGKRKLEEAMELCKGMYDNISTESDFVLLNQFYKLYKIVCLF